MNWERKRDLRDWAYPFLFMLVITIVAYLALWVAGYAQWPGDRLRLPSTNLPFFN